jgi:hypothetical protein
MNIASVYSSPQAQQLAEINEDAKRRNTRFASGSRGDTVSFSEEALALAAELATVKDIEANRRDPAGARNPGGDAEQEPSEEADPSESAASAGIGASSSDIDAQIEKLKAQILQTAQQMNAVMSGPASPEEKMSRTQPLQQRINTLEQQIQELSAMKQEAEMKALQSA